MAEYNLAALSPNEFEALVADLLSAETGTHWSRFSPGPDQGVDFQYLCQTGSTSIGQAKHYPLAAFSKLLADLRKEVPKVAKKRPDTYIVATSKGLSPQQHDTIASLFHDCVQTSVRVLGKDDLTALVARFSPDIEYRHYKLWLTSANIVARLLHNHILLYTEYSLEAIERQLSKYVQTATFAKARRLLEEHHVAILSGAPGVGKTTLAEALVASYLKDEYYPIVVTSSIAEAYSLLVPDRNCVIYYDDFLGRISLDPRLDKNEDASLLRLIDKARKSNNLRLILTTREYILQEALTQYERLATDDLESNKLLLAIEEYSTYDRACILYNHLYFSDLPTEHVKSIASSPLLQTIVHHRSFNPRIIDSVTRSKHATISTAEDFPNLIIQSLNRPTLIYEHIFDNQLTEDEASLLIVLYSFKEECELDDLKSSFVRFLFGQELAACDYGANRRFERALRKLDDSLVRTHKENDLTIISFINPSVQGFVTSRVEKDRLIVRRLLETATYFDQCFLSTSWDFRRNFKEPLEPLSCFIAAVRRTFGSPLPTQNNRDVDTFGTFIPGFANSNSGIARAGRVIDKLRAYISPPPADFLIELEGHLMQGMDSSDASDASCYQIVTALASVEHSQFYSTDTIAKLKRSALATMLVIANQPADWQIIVRLLRNNLSLFYDFDTEDSFRRFDEILESAANRETYFVDSYEWSSFIDIASEIQYFRGRYSTRTFDNLVDHYNLALLHEEQMQDEVYAASAEVGDVIPEERLVDIPAMFRDLEDGHRFER